MSSSEGGDFQFDSRASCERAIEQFRQSHEDRCGHELAREVVGLLISLYPAREMNDPEAFLTYAVHSLVGLPADVVVMMAHPSYGLARSCKFMPSIAEMVQWCEREVKERREAVDAAHKRLAILRRREMLTAGPIVDEHDSLALTWSKLGSGR